MENQTLENQAKALITEVTEKLKALPEATEKQITEKINEVKSELKDYIDKVRQNNVTLGLTDQEVNKFKFHKVIKAISDNNWDNAGYEKEVIQEAHKRSTVNGMTGGQGGYLIPVEVAKEIIEPALANTVMNSLGITVLKDLVGDLPMPEYTTRPVLAFGKENFKPTAQNISFGQKILRPKTGKMLVTVSQRLQYQSSGTAEQIVRQALQDGIEIGIDKILINGKGTDGEPMGIVNAGINTSTAIGTNGGRLKVDKVAQMIADVQDKDYIKIKKSGGMLTNPRVLSGMKRERVAQFSGDTAGMPLINPLVTDEMLADLLGLKIATTTSVPKNLTKGSSTTCSYAIIGEWKQYVAAMWGGLRIKSSDMTEDAFSREEIWFLAAVDMDSHVKQVNAFTMVSDCETNETLW